MQRDNAQGHTRPSCRRKATKTSREGSQNDLQQSREGKQRMPLKRRVGEGGGVQTGHATGSGVAGAAAGAAAGVGFENDPERGRDAAAAAAEVQAPDDDAVRRTLRLPKKSKRRCCLSSITETN